MKKSELITAVHKLYPFLKLSQVALAVDLIFLTLAKGLSQEVRAEIRGFGSFMLRKRKVQVQFSTQAEPIKFMNKNNVYFRMGKEIFDRLNEK
jgi:nucleoid DNA-binding protein